MGNKVNFFHTASYVKNNNLNHYEILKKAYEVKMLVDKNKKLLFISCERPIICYKDCLNF